MIGLAQEQVIELARNTQLTGRGGMPKATYRMHISITLTGGGGLITMQALLTAEILHLRSRRQPHMLRNSRQGMALVFPEVEVQ